MDFQNKMLQVNPQVSTKERAKYGEGKEAMGAKEEIGDFDLASSAAYSYLTTLYGRPPKLSKLKTIITASIEYLRMKRGIYLPKMSRNANRNYRICMKYIDEHLIVLRSILPFVKLYDQDMKPICIESPHPT